MISILQLIINGLVAGSIYALIASGFSLIFNIERFFHLAHGAVYAAGAFFAFTLTSILHVNIVISLLLAIIFSMLLGVLINTVAYRPIKKLKNNEFPLLLVSYGVFILVEGLILLLFGPEIKTFGLPIATGYKILGAYITNTQIMLIVVSILAIIGLQLFLRKTRIGKSLRAIADNKTVSKTLGIDVDTATLVVFAIGSALAGLAGVLVGLEQTIDPRMGFIAIIKGVVAAIIGGIGNVPASLAGGYLLGLVENLGIIFLPSGFKDAISCVILVIFLLIRPRGLFGTKKREDI